MQVFTPESFFSQQNPTQTIPWRAGVQSILGAPAALGAQGRGVAEGLGGRGRKGNSIFIKI